MTHRPRNRKRKRKQPATLSTGMQGDLLWESTFYPAVVHKMKGDSIEFKFPKSKNKFYETDLATARRVFIAHE